jgi:hypothetical protein
VLSTAQDKPGAAVSTVLQDCVKMQRALALHAAAAFQAAGAAQPTSVASAASVCVHDQGVAAGWFVVGCCLLPMGEHLERCASQRSSYTLSDWFVASAQMWGCSVMDHEALCEELQQWRAALTQLLDVTEGWGRLVDAMPSSVMDPASSSGSSNGSNGSSSRWLIHHAVQIFVACQVLQNHVLSAMEAVSAPQMTAAISHSLRAASTSGQQQQQQQQRQQQHISPAVKQALMNLSAGLSWAGGLLCAALPNRYFCNNPGCRNVAGCSAGFGLVRGRACVCGGCVVGAQDAAGVTGAPRGAVAAR